MVPTLIVVGCVTTLVFLANKKNTPQMAALSILGHMLLYLPYATCGLPKVSLYPSVALLMTILCVYMALDVWPYPVSPVEFAVLGFAAMATFSL
jgi:hypothetical protein